MSLVEQLLVQYATSPQLTQSAQNKFTLHFRFLMNYVPSYNMGWPKVHPQAIVKYFNFSSLNVISIHTHSNHSVASYIEHAVLVSSSHKKMRNNTWPKIQHLPLHPQTQVVLSYFSCVNRGGTCSVSKYLTERLYNDYTIEFLINVIETVHQSGISLGRMPLGSENMWFLLAKKLLTIMRRQHSEDKLSFSVL
jgi:hypothetical protein